MFRKERKVILTHTDRKTMAVALYQYKGRIEDSISGVSGNSSIKDKEQILSLLREEKEDISSALDKLNQLAGRG